MAKSRARRLQERLEAASAPTNVANDQAWRNKRMRELNEAYGSPEAALQRVELEFLCRQRMYLPKQGLGVLWDDLLRSGFCFQEHDEQFVAAFFPDGWKLEVDNFKHGYKFHHFAHLIDPKRRSRATIFYRAFSYIASITGPSNP